MTFWSDPINFVAELLRGLLVGWGLSLELTNFLLTAVGAAALATGGMLWVIFLIWYERKLIGRIQDRLGPNRVGPWGIFQPIADMLKIFTKEYITPDGADIVPFNLAPILAVAGTLAVWAVVPFAITIYGVDLDVAILYIVAVTGLSEFGVVLAGWGSNNKYALLGAFRSVAQLISYEVPMVLSLLLPLMLAGTMSINGVVKAQSIWFVFLAPMAALIFFISQLAEVGRAPFDLVEAESEIVAGFMIEYSGLKFGMFYVAEFLHAFTISLLFAALFLGGWRGPGAEVYPLLGFFYFSVKTALVYFVVILFRGSLPRFRIDQMMDLNWKVLTPSALALVIVSAVVIKLVPAGHPWLLLGAMLAVNLFVLLITLQFLRNAGRARRRANVAPRPYAGNPAQPTVE